ncbi:MAG TPA: MBL fold metallo-hydrolase [Acidimicrobiales bacterium]|nr:MBL fold metallo-hydrolase [Acidimicrobiales bacterium]
MSSRRADGPLALTVLGCDGSYPGPGGACSGYLVTCATTTVWLDAGPGTLAALQTHIDMRELDAVVLTHEHADHWSDLEHFAVACKWYLGRTGVPVHAPADLIAAARRRLGEVDLDGARVLDWRPTTPDEQLSIGAMTFTFSRTDHPVQTFAVRVDAHGRSLGYSADTGPRWPLSALGPDLDLAVVEATWLADHERDGAPHLSARQAGATARAAGAARLVLTHVLPTVPRAAAEDEAEAAFGGPVEVAGCGARYVV